MATTTQPQTADELIASFDAACKARPASRPPVTREEAAEVRAALGATFRAGDVHPTRDIKGQFNGATRIAHIGPRPAAPVRARKVAVEAPRPSRDRAPASVVALSVEV